VDVPGTPPLHFSLLPHRLKPSMHPPPSIPFPCAGPLPCSNAPKSLPSLLRCQSTTSEHLRSLSLDEIGLSVITFLLSGEHCHARPTSSFSSNCSVPNIHYHPPDLQGFRQAIDDHGMRLSTDERHRAALFPAALTQPHVTGDPLPPYCCSVGSPFPGGAPPESYATSRPPASRCWPRQVRAAPASASRPSHFGLGPSREWAAASQHCGL
jgi:hypothetical protein